MRECAVLIHHAPGLTYNIYIYTYIHLFQGNILVPLACFELTLGAGWCLD